MRLVVARCSVDYRGRLEAHLPEAVRLIMVKADGCVAIHSDGGAYKPLNWMNAPNTLVASGDEWVVANPKGESITIHLHEVFSDTSHDLGVDPGLRKDGAEAHLQELLAASVPAIEDKRRGEIDGVEQLARYIERLRLDSSLGEIRGVFVAQQVKPQAKVLAASRGLRVVEVDYDELRGMKIDELRLF